MRGSTTISVFIVVAGLTTGGVASGATGAGYWTVILPVPGWMVMVEFAPEEVMTMVPVVVN